MTPGKDAFHRVPDFARDDWDAVERVPTGLVGRTPAEFTFGACHLAGSAGHARRFNKQNNKRK